MTILCIINEAICINFTQPEGTEENVVQSRYIAFSPSSSFYTTTFNINYPSNIVLGSQKVKLSVTGEWIVFRIGEFSGYFKKHRFLDVQPNIPISFLYCL